MFSGNRIKYINKIKIEIHLVHPLGWLSSGIKLHTSIDGTTPGGSYVKWTASNNNSKTEQINNGNSLKIVSDKEGKTTFTATLYSKDGEILATDTIEMRSKAGFFDKLGSFFRSLFGSTKIYEN